MYNHAAYVEECLDSILDEEWPRLELLVLDDGSKDDSFAVAKRWIETNQARFERVFLETQPNCGLCTTLNRLIRETRGEYVAFSASDDSLICGGIRRRVGFLQQHPECLAVFGKVEVIGDPDRKKIIDLKKSQIRHAKSWLDPKLIARQFLLNGTLVGPSTIFRKEAFDEEKGVGLYDGSLAIDDLDMYLRLLSRDALRFIDESVGNYRIPEARTFFFSPPEDEFCRTYAKFKNSFSGLNRMLVVFQIWRNTAGSDPRAQRKRWIGRQMLSLFKRLHRIEKLFARKAH